MKEEEYLKVSAELDKMFTDLLVISSQVSDLFQRIMAAKESLQNSYIDAKKGQHDSNSGKV